MPVPLQKIRIERKTLLTIRVKRQKNINGLLMDLRFPICTGFIKAKTVAWIKPMRAVRFLFLLRQRGLSRQALGGPNDDKFMQLRWCQRTFAGRCAPPRLKYFWWWRKRILSELSCLISHLGEIKEWCWFYRGESKQGLAKWICRHMKTIITLAKQNESRQNIQRVYS